MFETSLFRIWSFEKREFRKWKLEHEMEVTGCVINKLSIFNPFLKLVVNVVSEQHHVSLGQWKEWMLIKKDGGLYTGQSLPLRVNLKWFLTGNIEPLVTRKITLPKLFEVFSSWNLDKWWWGQINSIEILYNSEILGDIMLVTSLC